MAVWQADYLIVPAKNPEEILKEDRRGFPWWESSNVLNKDIGLFQNLLPKIPSWLDSIDVYGFEDGNRIDVSYETGKITDVFVRIDLRNLNSEFMEGLLRVCSKNHLHLLDESNEIIEPNKTALIQSLMKSPAFRWVKDPIYYLNNENENPAV